MSDPVDRTVSGPPPRRRASASTLLQQNRGAEASQEVQPTVAAPSEQTWPPAGIAPVPSPVTHGIEPEQPRGMEPGGEREPSQNVAPRLMSKVTFDLPTDLRNRVRLVYKRTNSQEDDDTFAHMMRKIIEAECERREALYNGGERFAGESKPLRGGRPLGS